MTSSKRCGSTPPSFLVQEPPNKNQVSIGKEPRLDRILSKILEGMPPAHCQWVKMSSKFVLVE